jgi:large subunit ribosomal protein L13
LKTFSVKPAEIKREWHVIDAKSKILGKLTTEVARLLMGKHKAIFSRHLDSGDYVVVINAAKVKVSGDKAEQKLYYRHSGYPGGFRSASFTEMLKKKPEWVIEHAVKGMLPKNRLGNSMIKKLRVYAEDSHPHPVKATDSK